MARDAAILVVQKERPGDETGDWKHVVGLSRQPMTHDTFWRTFYAVRTTRSEFATTNFYDTAIIHDQPRLIRIQYLFYIGL